MEHVIAERTFAEPVDLASIERMIAAGESCLRSHRIRHLRTCVSLDGRRTICEYAAPDAESVRAASDRLGIPYERVWTVKLVYEPAPEAAVVAR
jgi:hypothetical protein